MNVFRWLGNYWWAIIPAIIFAGLLLFANSTPQESTFVWQDRADKLLILVFGAVYLLVRSLPAYPAAVMLLGYVILLAGLLRWLIRTRRIPTLIPFVLLLAVNCIVFSAPGLVLSRSLGMPDVYCEMFVTPQTGLKIIRYPVDVRLDYAEQQFFLITHDGGQTWKQFAESFIYDPVLIDCEYVESFNESGGIVQIERGSRPGEREIIRYMTSDAGHTWTVQE